jgi:DNA-directed RNA polymerase III subunit RPC3
MVPSLPSSTANNATSPLMHQSPLSTKPHNGIVSLASQIIRNHFGEVVQTVADALQSREQLSLSKLYEEIISKRNHSSHHQHHQKNRITKSHVRAALLVLIQHGIVEPRIAPTFASTIHSQKQKQQRKRTQPQQPQYAPVVYRYNALAAVHRLRYAKMVEYIKRAVDETAAVIVLELAVLGRARTVELIRAAAEKCAPEQTNQHNRKLTLRQSVAETMCKLVQAGFIQKTPEIGSLLIVPDNEDEDEGETEFEMDANGSHPPRKRVKIDAETAMPAQLNDEDPAVVAILHSNAQWKNTLPIDAVWKINISLFHESLRAFHIGKLVAEIHGHRVQSAGSLITAALKYRAHYNFHNKDSNDFIMSTTFRPADILKYVPKPVIQLLEQKHGGLHFQIQKSFQQMADQLRNPLVVRRVGDDLFEVAVRSLVDFLQDRIAHQIVYDRHGEVAARVVSILNAKGWLESDALAELAMVPARDTREILHHLFRSRYVEIFHLSSSSSGTRQYNPASAIYLWGVDRKRLLIPTIRSNVATALWNIRLRRENHVQCGKIFLERAAAQQQQQDNGKNGDSADNRNDQLQYERFCLGLERLDVATLQLDETMMALHDF